jgi:hypothetical protein
MKAPGFVRGAFTPGPAAKAVAERSGVRLKQRHPEKFLTRNSSGYLKEALQTDPKTHGSSTVFFENLENLFTHTAKPRRLLDREDGRAAPIFPQPGTEVTGMGNE